MSSQSHGEHSGHPTLKQYVIIAIILFAITIVEFFIIWPVNRIGAASTPILIILSCIKFAIVIFYYMHLKFDQRLLTWIFLGGLALGLLVSLSLLTLFSSIYATPEPRAYAAANAVPYVHGEEGHAVAESGGHEETGDSSSVSTEASHTDPVSADTSGAGDSSSSGNVDLGMEVFAGSGGCGACHTVEGVAAGMVGPDLTHIGSEAASRKPGMSPEDYLIESIKMPEAFVAEGVERAMPGLMTAAVTSHLTDEQVEGLVAFLLEQK